MKNMVQKQIQPNEFYELENLEDKLRFILQYAMLAPSRNNTKPWLFEVSGNQIRIFADLSKRLDQADPYYRELYLSLGCVIANLEIAAEYYELKYSTCIFTGEPINNIVAIVNILPETNTHNIYPSNLFENISKRYIDRNPYLNKPISQQDIKEIYASIRWIEGVSLHIVDREEIINYLAELTYQAEQEQFENTAYRDEQIKWLTTDHNHDGLPISFFHLSPINSLIFPFYKNFNFGEDKIDYDLELIKASPYVGILTSDGNEKSDWITTGVAFQILALNITRLGLAYQPMTAITEEHSAKTKLQEMLRSTKTPQMFFRFGYPAQI
jgi:hypothetical protein